MNEKQEARYLELRVLVDLRRTSENLTFEYKSRDEERLRAYRERALRQEQEDAW